MKHPIRLAMGLLALALAATAGAADLPRRKSGLWEIETKMSGMPSAGPIRMCIDQRTDDIANDGGPTGEKADCPVLQVKRQGSSIVVHSVCRHDGTTATTDGTITGDLDRQYRSDMKTRFDPPQDGMREVRVNQEARWLGPCAPGQKAGDVIMPGVGGYNLPEALNDPRLKEMMRQFR